MLNIHFPTTLAHRLYDYVKLTQNIRKLSFSQVAVSKPTLRGRETAAGLMQIQWGALLRLTSLNRAFNSQAVGQFLR